MFTESWFFPLHFLQYILLRCIGFNKRNGTILLSIRSDWFLLSLFFFSPPPVVECDQFLWICKNKFRYFWLSLSLLYLIGSGSVLILNLIKKISIHLKLDWNLDPLHTMSVRSLTLFHLKERHPVTVFCVWKYFYLLHWPLIVGE